MYVHEVLVNRLGGLSLPRKSVVRLTDRPDMTLDVYRGRKTTTQQHLIKNDSISAQLYPHIKHVLKQGMKIVTVPGPSEMGRAGYLLTRPRN